MQRLTSIAYIYRIKVWFLQASRVQTTPYPIYIDEYLDDLGNDHSCDCGGDHRKGTPTEDIIDAGILMRAH
jgi:hypothetical protein